MKGVVGVIVFVLLAGNIFSQDINQSDIPAVVLNSFQLKYPNAADVKWKLDRGNYKIDYKVNSKANKLTLDYKGTILEHSQDLYISEIPKVVLNTIKTKVAYFDVQDADKLESEGKTTYLTRFKIDGQYYYFWINENGELLKYRRELKESEIPVSILHTIQNQFGKLDIERAKYVEDNGIINYIIGGEINSKDHVFWFSSKSVLLKHTQDLRDSEIPPPILNTLTTSYKDYDIRDADLIEERGNQVYILRMRKSKEQVYVTFNKDGKVLEVK